MIDHPNQFPIGQRVLVASDNDSSGRWRPGTVVAAADISHIRESKVYGDYTERTVEAKFHAKECEGYLYSVFVDDADPWSEPDKVCTCRSEIVTADPSGRWRNGAQITKRSQLRLLVTDLGPDLKIDSSNTPLEETDIVHLSVGDASAEVDIHDLLKWAATPGGEG